MCITLWLVGHTVVSVSRLCGLLAILWFRCLAKDFAFGGLPQKCSIELLPMLPVQPVLLSVPCTDEEEDQERTVVFSLGVSIENLRVFSDYCPIKIHVFLVFVFVCAFVFCCFVVCFSSSSSFFLSFFLENIFCVFQIC